MLRKTKQIRAPQRNIKRTRSTSQVKRQKAYQRCSNFWSRGMPLDLRLEWQRYAPGKLTGYNYYLKINIVREYNDLRLYRYPWQVV